MTELGGGPAVGERAPVAELTSAVDGSRVGLARLFSSRSFTVLLFDGVSPTSDGYKRLVGLALDIASRWGERAASYIVTSRNDRPFEIPCEVGILFDDRDGALAVYGAKTEQAYVIDTAGMVTFRVSPVDLDAVLAHLGANLDG